MGQAFDDVDHISTMGSEVIEIGFRRPAPFLLEALDAPISKPGSFPIGTGAYIPAGPAAPNEMRANANYYLGPPVIDRIVVNTYPGVRSAWADMLRDRIDVLYEVGVDALDSLTSSKNIAVHTYVRHYQYVLMFNTRAPSLRSAEVRRALNAAVDRPGLVRDALDGHAVPSSGLV